MTEKEPADDPAAGMERYDHLGRESIQRAPHDGALGRIDVRQIRAVNQMGVQLEPADEGIAFAVLDVVSFGEATQPGAEPVAVALSYLGKNSDAPDAGRVRYAFDDVGQQRLDVIEPPKHARKTQERQGYLGTFERCFRAAHRLRCVGCEGVVTEIPIFLEHAQMIESA